MKKSVKEYMQDSPLFDGIIAKEEEDSGLMMESLEAEINEKKFEKMEPMPQNVAELHAICSRHKGFCDLQKRAAAAGIIVNSGFIQYRKYVAPKDVNFSKIVLERVVLNLTNPDSSVTGFKVYFKSDDYGNKTSDKANKLQMDASIYTKMDSSQLLKAKEEIDALIKFVVWFNSQKIEKLLPLVGEVKELRK